MGRVLDTGCGSREHALMAAAAGLDVTGIDRDAGVLALARGKARARGLTVRFLQVDALGLAAGCSSSATATGRPQSRCRLTSSSVLHAAGVAAWLAVSTRS